MSQPDNKVLPCYMSFANKRFINIHRIILPLLDRFYISPRTWWKALSRCPHPYLLDHKYIKIILKLPALNIKNKVKKDREGFWN